MKQMYYLLAQQMVMCGCGKFPAETVKHSKAMAADQLVEFL